MKFNKFIFGKRSGAIGLMDILISMAILAAIIALALPLITQVQNKFKGFKTKTALNSLKIGIDMYSMHNNGRPPSKREGGLSALLFRPEGSADWWEGPYIPGSTKGQQKEDFVYLDGWGNPVEYNCPPVEFPDTYKKYELISHGPDESDKNGFVHQGN